MPSRRTPPPSGDTLFSAEERRQAERDAPLATRMRPRTLDEFIGQEQIVGEGRMLRRALERDAVPSLILWGPPGSGKTTLAAIIAGATNAHVEPLSAVSSGVADLRRSVQEARLRRRDTGRRTILFIDEIHRFNKAQQDAILPHVEDGAVTLIGATTENPSFEVVSPLLSRSRVVVLRALTEEEIAALIRRALADTERGLGGLGLEIDDDALDALSAGSGGDARVALNTLEVAVAQVLPPDRRIALAHVREALQHRGPRYDKGGESHYDQVSALIKSIRGSDPDAAVYWLARMLAGGEDPLFIARRLIIAASEDVGMADSRGLQVAVAAQQAVHVIGMPEALFPLTHATIYLATAPKSNSAKTAYAAAAADVERTLNQPVPLHLRNAVTGMMRGLGYGQGYRYAHDYEGHYVEQQHLPDALAGRQYYQPGGEGEEASVRDTLARRRPPRPTGDRGAGTGSP
jgi:putative ATPase